MMDHTPSRTSEEAIGLARSLFLRDDNHYGCAETTLVALQELYGFHILKRKITRVWT